MNYLNKFAGGTFALALLVGVGASQAQAADVVDTAASVDDLSTLVSLVQAADLVDALKSADDITVFAPTNDAFENLPSRISRAIEINPDILTTILLYHVAPERLRAADVVEFRHIDTLANDPLRVRTPGDMVKIDRSTVIATDIETDNATVHLIDRVLIPNNLIREDVTAALSSEQYDNTSHELKNETHVKTVSKQHWNSHYERMHEHRERIEEKREQMKTWRDQHGQRWSEWRNDWRKNWHR